MEKAIIIFENHRKNIAVDIEVPLWITASEFLYALNAAYDLGIDMSDARKCCLISESPIALLRGDKTLAQCGIRNGSIISCAEQEIRENGK